MGKLFAGISNYFFSGSSAMYFNEREELSVQFQTGNSKQWTLLQIGNNG